ncbi:hypothetical protein CRUP_013240 [Coryphaenoides rupestris]|nr:hypothetical protein CRUP_013240 [Coryphaenoides rupestris]
MEQRSISCHLQTSCDSLQVTKRQTNDSPSLLGPGLCLCPDLYTFGVREDAPVGTTVGRVKADDGDVGANARMNYTLQDLEESETFIIQLDPDTQEGLILLAKVRPITESVDKRQLVEQRWHGGLRLETVTQYLTGLFRVSVSRALTLPTSASAAKTGGSSTSSTNTLTVARSRASSALRYSIERHSDISKAFQINPNNGTITLLQPLDREAANWHNVTVVAKETRAIYPRRRRCFIKVLDVNDNAPALARDYRPYICEGALAGELIQVLSAVDPDDPCRGTSSLFLHDNTASIVARRSTFTRKDRTQYLLPVVLADSGVPPLSSTSTLTVTVCGCEPAGHCPLGGAGVEALALSMGASLKTLLGVLVCLATLSAFSILTLVMRRRRRRRRKQQEVSGMEEHDGGADLELPRPGPVPLRPHPRRRDRKLRREEVAASIRMSLRHSHLIGPEDEVFRQFIFDRLAEADQDPYVPPFDCLRTYAFEGAGSEAGSLSSLDSCGLADFSPEPPITRPKPYVVQLTPWYGSDEDTF